MKRLISITIAAMLLLSSLFAVNAFAETATYDEPGYSLTDSIEDEIKQAILERVSSDYPDLTIEDIEFEYFGTLSDGSVLLRYRFSAVYPGVIEDKIIGPYHYI